MQPPAFLLFLEKRFDFCFFCLYTALGKAVPPASPALEGEVEGGYGNVLPVGADEGVIPQVLLSGKHGG